MTTVENDFERISETKKYIMKGMIHLLLGTILITSCIKTAISQSFEEIKIADDGLFDSIKYQTLIEKESRVLLNNLNIDSPFLYNNIELPCAPKFIKADQAGNIFIGGWTSNQENIATGGSYQDTLCGGIDAVLMKYNLLGDRIWGTYFGGPGNDYAEDIDICDDGSIVICGTTNSNTGIATAGSHMETSAEGFIAKFDSSGNNLQWATYYPGEFTGIVVGASDTIIACGIHPDTIGIATPVCHQSEFANSFLVKFSSEGERMWGTYFGGLNTNCEAIDVDTVGNFYITGDTKIQDSNIATSGSYMSEAPGGYLYYRHPYFDDYLGDDAYLVKFNCNGIREWGTYYGGDHFERAYDVLVTLDGDILLTGTTQSIFELGSPGLQEQITPQGNWGVCTSGIGSGSACEPPDSCNGCPFPMDCSNCHMFNSGDTLAQTSDIFLARFNPEGQRLWGTYYGWKYWDYGLSLETDQQGNAILGCNKFSLVKPMEIVIFDSLGNLTNNYTYQSLDDGSYPFPSCDIAMSNAGNLFCIGSTWPNILTRLNLELPCPVFNKQPQAQKACIGDTLSLHAKTNDPQLISYQWYKNNSVITGAIDTVYTIYSFDKADTGFYKCTAEVGPDSNKVRIATGSAHISLRTNQEFETYLTGFPGGTPGDYDGDGDYDFLSNSIWKNENGIYTNNDIIFPGQCIWLDQNNDNKLDIISISSDSIRIYYNQDGEFIKSNQSLIGCGIYKHTVEDFDGDGDNDLLIINSWPDIEDNIRYLKNIGDGGYIDDEFIPGVYLSIQPGEFNNDGIIDFAALKKVSPEIYHMLIIKFIEGEFIIYDTVNLSISPNNYMNCFDYDQDADLDIFCGTNWSSINLYRNDGGNFTIHNIPNVNTSMSIGDLNCDGSSDLLLGNSIYLNYSGEIQYCNDVNFGLIMDYNDDGLLDIYRGYDWSENLLCHEPNEVPQPPADLEAIIDSNSVTLTWSRGSDFETTALGLTYNLRVGSSFGGCEIKSSNSNPTGFRQIIAVGNAYSDTLLKINDLSPGTYFWSVQSVDNSYAGGPFAEEQVFQVAGPPQIKTWTGVINDLWSTAGNWNPPGIPLPDDEVFIPSSASHMPVVRSNGYSCYQVTLAQGATLTINPGIILTISGE